jgi:hypothetical protein
MADEIQPPVPEENQNPKPEIKKTLRERAKGLTKDDATKKLKEAQLEEAAAKKELKKIDPKQDPIGHANVTKALAVAKIKVKEAKAVVEKIKNSPGDMKVRERRAKRSASGGAFSKVMEGNIRAMTPERAQERLAKANKELSDAKEKLGKIDQEKNPKEHKKAMEAVEKAENEKERAEDVVHVLNNPETTTKHTAAKEVDTTTQDMIAYLKAVAEHARGGTTEEVANENKKAFDDRGEEKKDAQVDVEEDAEQATPKPEQPKPEEPKPEEPKPEEPKPEEPKPEQPTPEQQQEQASEAPPGLQVATGDEALSDSTPRPSQDPRVQKAIDEELDAMPPSGYKSMAKVARAVVPQFIQDMVIDKAAKQFEEQTGMSVEDALEKRNSTPRPGM